MTSSYLGEVFIFDMIFAAYKIFDNSSDIMYFRKVKSGFRELYWTDKVIY